MQVWGRVSSVDESLEFGGDAAEGKARLLGRGLGTYEPAAACDEKHMADAPFPQLAKDVIGKLHAYCI